MRCTNAANYFDMDSRNKRAPSKPFRRLNNIGAHIRASSSSEVNVRAGSTSGAMNAQSFDDNFYEDDHLAPIMPAIDAVQQLIEEESRSKLRREKLSKRRELQSVANSSAEDEKKSTSNQLAPPPKDQPSSPSSSTSTSNSRYSSQTNISVQLKAVTITDNVAGIPPSPSVINNINNLEQSSPKVDQEDEGELIVEFNPSSNLITTNQHKKQEEYEFIPKSVTLDIYSNDPEVKRFLKQLPRIGTEFGYNEQDYKCYSCRRPIGMVFGQSRLCYFDGHHYCFECHLEEKSAIPAKILCNWDFNKYPISKRNQHFLNLISNEPMFELKTIAPLLYKNCHELKEVEELRCQAFFIRSYCFTCVQDSASFELRKLVWPREHLIKQIDLYSLEDLIQVKSGALKQVLKNVITFGRQHVLSCMLCCQKGFICEICKSSQIIYPFDTETVYRCNSCQSIYHKVCFKSKSGCNACPRCQRLKARRSDAY